MSASPPREAARRVVSAVRTRGGWAHDVADSVLASAGLDARDAAFATRLAYGTISAQGTLDEAIDRFASKPSSIEPKVRDALRVAAWELLFGAAPDRAAVSEGVELARTASPRAAGFANAVLRKLAENRSSFPWGDTRADRDALARATAHPRWIVDVAIDELGEAAALEMLAADNEAAPLYLAVNPFRGDIEAAEAVLAEDGAEPSACGIPGCLVAGVPSAAVRGRAVADGLVIVVDAAAQLAVKLAAPPAGGTVVEIGAGRGTKCLLLQAAAVARGGAADIIGVDLHDFKVKVLDDRMIALGVGGVRGVVANATDVEALAAAVGGDADLVFVDAPCSGLGTLRRHPDKRWRVTPADVSSVADLGARLLRASAHLVKPGGVVVYSTCTITSEENQRVVEGFLGGEGSGFRVDPVAGKVPGAWERFVTAEGYFRSWPTAGGPDGHFVARMVREK